MNFTSGQQIIVTLRGDEYAARFIKYRTDGYVLVFVFSLVRKFKVKPEQIREIQEG